MDSNNTVVIRLLCAKSRVAPPKQLTIPRLELCAAKLAAELMKRLQEILKLKGEAFFLWSDSTAVLGWINSDSAHYHTFVANRIATIQQLTSPRQWQHIRSELNPADLISRGITPDKLINNNFWFYGPIFLHGSEEMWPIQPTKFEDCCLEKRDKFRAALTASVENQPTGREHFIDTINHHNSFRRLQRIMSFILRFCNRRRTSMGSIAPTASEMEDSLAHIIRIIQLREFPDDLKQLARHGTVHHSSAISSLTPFIDDKGILRVGGRLESSALSYEAKHPALLPDQHPLSKLLLTDLHKEKMHAGAQTLLAIVRQRFWPIKGKSLARSVIKNCVHCTRARP